MTVAIDRYPQLRLLCWNRPAGAVLEEAEALALYERNWRFIDQGTLTPGERALIDRLAARHGGGVLLVP